MFRKDGRHGTIQRLVQLSQHSVGAVNLVGASKQGAIVGLPIGRHVKARNLNTSEHGSIHAGSNGSDGTKLLIGDTELGRCLVGFANETLRLAIDKIGAQSMGPLVGAIRAPQLVAGIPCCGLALPVVIPGVGEQWNAFLKRNLPQLLPQFEYRPTPPGNFSAEIVHQIASVKNQFGHYLRSRVKIQLLFLQVANVPQHVATPLGGMVSIIHFHVAEKDYCKGRILFVLVDGAIERVRSIHTGLEHHQDYYQAAPIATNTAHAMLCWFDLEPATVRLVRFLAR